MKRSSRPGPKGSLFLWIALFSSFAATAQQQTPQQAPAAGRHSSISQFLDLSATIGDKEGALAASFVHNWRIGKNKKWEAGIGLRLTTYLGSRKDFYTAPARLARSTTVPFVIVFAGHEEKNIDTLTIERPFTVSLNISANVGYHFNSRWYGGFNIDLLGYTLGSGSSASLVSNGVVTNESLVRPAHFNALLTGDNDYGSLNSEFFLRYRLNGRLSIKAVYQFFFAEYKTQTIRQIAPDGTSVDRFRNKANTFGLGLTWHLRSS